MSRSRLYPTLQALLAAALFGISSPVSKALLGEVAPIPMAALLYLGSGVGTWLLMRFPDRDAEARLTRADIPWLAGALLAGGVAAPQLQGRRGAQVGRDRADGCGTDQGPSRDPPGDRGTAAPAYHLLLGCVV